MFAHWDEKVRPEIARIRGVKANDIKIDALGDLRVLRKSIVHNDGVISEVDYGKIRKMSGLFSPNATITLDHDNMHKLFVLIKQSIAELVLHHTGHLPGAPKASDLVDVAIQNVGKPRVRNPYGFWTVTLHLKQ